MGAASSIQHRERARSDLYVVKRSRSAEAESEVVGIALFPIMSETMKNSLQTHFHNTVLAQKPNIFDDVMIKCLESSCKLRHIVAQRTEACADTTHGRTANHICEQQKVFYDRLINVCKLDPVAVAEAVCLVGYAHFRLTPLGFKSHFFDIWKCHMEKIVHEVDFPSEEEKALFLKAFGILNGYVVGTMSHFKGQWGSRSFEHNGNEHSE